MEKTASMTVHIRVPLPLKKLIAARAEHERRTWTQMAVLLLEDAMTHHAKAEKGKKR